MHFLGRPPERTLELAEGVFDDPELPLPVDQRHVEAHFRQKAHGFARHEFFGRTAQPGHLPRPQPFGRPREGPAFLHFDEDQAIAIPRDQVDFTRFAPPAAARDRQPARDVPRRPRSRVRCERLRDPDTHWGAPGASRVWGPPNPKGKPRGGHLSQVRRVVREKVQLGRVTSWGAEGG